VATFYHYLESPIDPLLLVSDGEALTGLYMDAHKYGPTINDKARGEEWRKDASLFTAVVEQLMAYFAGDLRVFNLPLRPKGTHFQQSVWRGLCEIPYARTISYKTLADNIAAPAAVRAVGLANGKNPISIIIPCHRVIGANGKLVGYGGGLNRKQWLLAHEAEHDPARLL
jgi:methylated-DNA-[protein]-cysteine S-methyltransferase